jgi:hypothetical protein
MLPIIPLIVLLAGILMYALSTNGKVVEIGRAMMWMALLVVLAGLASWHSLVLSTGVR